jgi:transcriptional regulator of heat shock response
MSNNSEAPRNTTVRNVILIVSFSFLFLFTLFIIFRRSRTSKITWDTERNYTETIEGKKILNAEKLGMDMQKEFVEAKNKRWEIIDKVRETEKSLAKAMSSEKKAQLRESLNKLKTQMASIEKDTFDKLEKVQEVLNKAHNKIGVFETGEAIREEKRNNMQRLTEMRKITR